MNITKINVLFLLIRLKGFAPQTPKDLSHYSQNFIFIGKIRRSYSLLLKFWHLKRRLGKMTGSLPSSPRYHPSCPIKARGGR